MDINMLPPIDGLETEECEDCQNDTGSDDRFKRIDHPLNKSDWSTGWSSQGYYITECKKCGCLWGVRFQYDAGTGSDDRWHKFGIIDPSLIAERVYGR